MRYLSISSVFVCALAVGCSQCVLDTPRTALPTPDAAFWSYRQAVQNHDYEEVFSILGDSQRQTLRELFCWLQRYAENAQQILSSVESRPEMSPEEKYALTFTVGGVSPLFEESMTVRNLATDGLRLELNDNSESFAVYYKTFSHGYWRKDPNVAIRKGPNDGYFIQLGFLWAQNDSTGKRIREQMIETCRKAIRTQEGGMNGTSKAQPEFKSE